MTHARDDGGDGLWQDFIAHPARHINAGRLVACFDGRFGADLCRRLQACRRLEARLSTIILTRHHLSSRLAPNACSAADRTIALATADELDRLLRRAGAIYWSAAIANVVLAEQVAMLHRQLDETLCAFAIANRDLAGPVRSIAPVDGLAQRVAEAGLRCLAAWCRAQPPEVGIRVRLKLPPADALDRAPEDAFVEMAIAIIHRAAQ
jgi:hypothetical protein